MKEVITSRILRTVPLLLIVVLFCPFAYGKVIYVDDDATGANDGTNWANAYIYLQNALADANSAEKPVEIRVAQGTYTPDCGNGYVRGDKQAKFLLKSGVTIKGGFAGVDADDPNAWDYQAYETVLSGDLSGNDERLLANFVENSDHVIWCIEGDASAVLDGFTITGGYATNRIGGGLFNYKANPTVKRCVFFDNYASQGGGMANRYSSPTVTQCTFSGNLAPYGGGGMYNTDQSHPIVESCVFYDNWTTILGGGGMYCGESNPVVTHCLFIDNVAPFGGGMYNAAANPFIGNCTFSDNRSNSWGGGMQNEAGADPTVTHCILWGNTPDGITTFGGFGAAANVTYSNVQGGHLGEGNMDTDPLFANPQNRDYHLKSQAGRWNTNSKIWVIDYVTSPCIDAGDPNTPIDNEPFPNGGIINMGAYGGTDEASKSPSDLHAQYGGGTGVPNDPYLIYTAAQMNAIGANPGDWNKQFKLMADIDLSDYTGTAFNIIGNWETGWTFHGVFDGNGKKISNFSYTSTDVNSIALFGYVGGAVIKDLGLIDPNVDAGTGDYVGSLVGYLSRGTITGCYVNGGSITGYAIVGGLVGDNGGTITNCYATGSVTGNAAVGGLVGYNGGTITNCYSSGYVLGNVNVGGLVGNGGRVTGSFWDIEMSGQSTSYGGTGKTTAEMQMASTFIAWVACEPVWTIDEGKDYPKLAWENMPGQMLTMPSFPTVAGSGTESDPYLIYTAEEINMIGLFPCAWDKHFKLMADIDLSAYTGTDFNIISYFIGVFDGNGHTISNFSYTSTDTRDIGLFGLIFLQAIVKDLGLIDPNIDAGTGDCVGSLVGFLNDGTITGCYVEGGSVSGNNCVGGLVGDYNEHLEVGIVEPDFTISNCYSTSSVQGTRRVGGLVGSHSWGLITNCYATGSVSGTMEVGGLVGMNWSGIINNSFWDIETSGQSSSDGGTGLPTDEMQIESTFTDAGWDFEAESVNGTEDIWSICEGTNYPRLAWQIPAGDFVCPDGITIEDFVFFIEHWGDDNCDVSNDYCDGTDLDFSGTVDEADLEILIENWLAGGELEN